MKRQQMGLTVLVAAAVATSVGTGAAVIGGAPVASPEPAASIAGAERPGTPPWFRALMIRSESLNRIHRLGPYSEAASQEWLPSLLIRSNALNARYGLGEG